MLLKRYSVFNSPSTVFDTQFSHINTKLKPPCPGILHPKRLFHIFPQRPPCTSFSSKLITMYCNSRIPPGFERKIILLQFRRRFRFRISLRWPLRLQCCVCSTGQEVSLRKLPLRGLKRQG